MNRREFGQMVATFAAGSAVQVAPRDQVAGGSLTDVPGIKVGHDTDTKRPTGCTAILFDAAVTAAVDYDGSAPGESQIAMLQPVSPVERIHALFLSGGGVMALPAHGGVLRFLEEHKVGFDWGNPGLRIPIVVSSVIDDLSVGDNRIRPDADAAYKACAAASSSAVAEGNVGAGAGATVGKMHRGRGLSGMKGGLGTASLKLGDLVIGALAVVNAAGDVLDWRTGTILAGARRPDGTFADSGAVMREVAGGPAGRGLPANERPVNKLPVNMLQDEALRSTTLAVVATNAPLTKTALTKVAMMANCGAARAIRPYHTTGDGDQMFAISTGALKRNDIPLTAIGSLAADVIGDAIGRAVRAAASIEGWPGLRDARPR
jgi:L-aminopeptidase/D-esterase-like protein